MSDRLRDSSVVNPEAAVGHGPVTVPGHGTGGRRPARLAARYGLPLCGYAALILVALAATSNFWQLELAMFSFYVLIGMSWNLIGGYAGQLNLGHAAFIGLGAYAMAILFTTYGILPWLVLPVAAAVAAIAALILGAITLRLRGLYLGLASVSLPFLLMTLFNYLKQQEIAIPQKASQFAYMEWSSYVWYTALFGLLALVTWYGTTVFEGSKWRIVLQALRDDQDATRSLGVNTATVKIAMFGISAALAGVAGAVYAQMILVVSSDSVFSVTLSIQPLLICLVGGLARKGAPIVGAAVLVGVDAVSNDFFGGSIGISGLAYGIVLMVFVLLLPSGVLKPAWQLWEWSLARLRGHVNRSYVADLEPAAPDVVSALPEAAAPPAEPPVPAKPPVPADHLVGAKAGHRDADGAGGTPADAVLECRSLRKTYGGVVAVDSLSFTIGRGEFVGVVGPNGAGKTTLFDLLTGYQHPTSGQTFVAGQETTRWPPHRIALLGARRSFQTARCFGDLTALENLIAGALKTSPTTAAAREAAMSALRTVGLQDVAGLPASSLTLAQLKLLEVGRAVAANPTILLLDEPLAGLERAVAVGVMTVLQRLRATTDLTIVLVDHDVGTVADYVDRMIVMDHGREIAIGAPAAVMQNPDVISAYLGEGWQRRGR